jgi:hypothetical protein
MLIELLAAFTAGLLVKIVDDLEDNKARINRVVKILLSISYGALIAYLVCIVNILPELWLGIIIGSVIAGKVDSFSHYIGVGSLIVFSLLFGVPTLNLTLLTIFSILGLLEERVHDYYSKKKNANILLKIRPVMELSALISSIIISNYLVIGLLLSFDLGYYASKYTKHCKFLR